ncbi:hypothetical protein [Streptomyces bambusae]|uniref:Uncharacterized protein n=1 Tax=Streptomyces bambusae TaxID=1550616 RepID=A0ABS6Z870_9ACTN|nr:hypothetical protein [Streptomyces bambusae]MBW5483927.1 hypothetical protein [Streptomyces bambusae]
MTAAYSTGPDRVSARIGSGSLRPIVPAGARFQADCRAGDGSCDIDRSLRDPASPCRPDLTTGSGHAEAGRSA